LVGSRYKTDTDLDSCLSSSLSINFENARLIFAEFCKDETFLFEVFLGLHFFKAGVKLIATFFKEETKE